MGRGRKERRKEKRRKGGSRKKGKKGGEKERRRKKRKRGKGHTHAEVPHRGTPPYRHCIKTMVHEAVQMKEVWCGRGGMPVLEGHFTEDLVGHHPALGVAGGEGASLEGGGRGEGGGKVGGA